MHLHIWSCLTGKVNVRPLGLLALSYIELVVLYDCAYLFQVGKELHDLQTFPFKYGYRKAWNSCLGTLLLLIMSSE